MKRFFAALLCLTLLLTPALALEGMDVSVYQGRVDFTAASQEVQAVIIRASYGETGVDPYYLSHYKAAKAAGLKVGFYHYLEAVTPDQARLEARHFASLIRDLDCDLRPALDYEAFHNQGRDAVTDVALAFLTTLEGELGARPMLYADSYAARHYFGAALGAYPLWVADWDVPAPDLSGSPWSTWAAWQYTDGGRIPGVAGRVDLDRIADAALLPSAPERTYTVQPGDTLWALSLRFHTTVAELVRLNDIQDPNLIYVGQVLRLPGGSPETFSYTVRPGDTLWALSLRFHTTVAELVRLNDIQNPDLIYPGQRLTIPSI